MHGAAVRRFLLALVGAVAAVAVVGALLAVMTGGAARHTIAVTFAVVGGILVVVNVVGGGSGGPIADARTGFGFGSGGLPDTTSSPKWLLVGLVLVGVGIAGILL
jgi:hypothetical protein